MRRDRTPDYRRGNTEAARIILSSPDVYGPGLVEWATMCLSRQGTHGAPVVRSVGQARKPEQLALFRQGEGAEARP